MRKWRKKRTFCAAGHLDNEIQWNIGGLGVEITILVIFTNFSGISPFSVKYAILMKFNIFSKFSILAEFTKM